MRKYLWPCVMLAALVFPHSCLADAPDGYPFLRFDEALRTAKQQHKKLFVYYGRYGCGYCDKTNKESFSDPALHKLYVDHYVLAYVDAESGRRLTLPSGEQVTEMEMGARLKALVTPVFIYMDSDGKTILRVPGFQTAHDFTRYDQYIYREHFKSQTLAKFLEQNP
jgi:thioredoxin-related protein